MNTAAELTDEELQSQLEKGLLQPDPAFKGRKFWPMSHGSWMLWENAGHEEDSTSFRVVTFLFIHLKRGGEKFSDDIRKVQDICWNPTALRACVLDLADELKLTLAEETGATALVKKAMVDMRKSEVKAEDEEPRKKKAAASRQAKPRGSSHGAAKRT